MPRLATKPVAMQHIWAGAERQSYCWTVRNGRSKRWQHQLYHHNKWTWREDFHTGLRERKANVGRVSCRQQLWQLGQPPVSVHCGHQRFIKPGDPRSGAFIVYDNDTESLYINGESGSKRSDCDEARERVAMGILLALQYQRTSDKKLLDALNNYVSFILRIQKPDYTTNSTVDFKSKNRDTTIRGWPISGLPCFRTTGNKQYLKRRVRHSCTGRLFQAWFFLASNIPTYGYTLLKENGFTVEADTLLNDFKSMADVFLKSRPNYPTSKSITNRAS